RNAEADAVPGGNARHRVPRIYLDRARGSGAGAAIFRNAWRYPAAAVASPAEHFSVREKRQRVVAAATDRMDVMPPLGGRCVHVLVGSGRQRHSAFLPVLLQCRCRESRVKKSRRIASPARCSYCSGRQAASAEISVVGATTPPSGAGTSSPGAMNPASGPRSFCFLRALWYARPVPAGISRPTITFSLRPRRSSFLPMIAASVSTRVVSWNDAAEMNESVDSDAFVMPSS